jgi:Tfp pilus assembly protein PilV
MARRSGLTLIEVVASLTLLAVTTVALLQAQNQALIQLRANQDQEIAAGLAHELITSWRIKTAERPEQGEGRFDDQPGWSWRLDSRPCSLAQTLPLEEFQLVINRRDSDGGVKTVARYQWIEDKAGDDAEKDSVHSR